MRPLAFRVLIVEVLHRRIPASASDRFTPWAAPDNGEESNGTEVYTYRATHAR
ncbi:hypothetical protein [Streptomyces sp. NPDC000880]